MARPRSHTVETLADRALIQFWSEGYCATSMDDLVRATGVSRHGIYADFGGKRDLFLACFDRYQETVVTPAFARVEAEGATLTDIAAYFEHQISLAESSGLPGPGCFVGNAATETAPHDPEIEALVQEHNTRLRKGFTRALGNSRTTGPQPGDRDLAEALVVFATGLWATSRLVKDAAPLRSSVATLLNILQKELT